MKDDTSAAFRESDLEVIFLDALEITDPVRREQFLVQQCAGRPELLHQVRELLDAGERPSILDHPLPEAAVAQSLLGGSPLQASFGPWKVRRLLGHGGMGSVYLAEQEQPVRRSAALKLIQLGQESDESLWRFQQEQQVLAEMSHPHIAALIDAAVLPSGVSWLAMEYVDGSPLLEWCQRNGADTEQKLRLFLQCCEAVRYAHQKAIIHRDLKPSNIMVADTPAGPVVKVIDFGVAKVLNDTRDGERTPSRKTRAGFLPGTPQYMSPEQLHGDQSVDTRTDVYSLGVVLYELLTGTEPHTSAARGVQMSRVSLMQSILESEPILPSQRVLQTQSSKEGTAADAGRVLSRRLRGDLDAIIQKAMARERERRYQSVAELLTDVQCHLQDQPILARPDSWAYRLRRQVLRNRGLVFAVLSVFMTLSVGILMANLQRQRAETSESRLKIRNYCADLLLASLAIDDGDSATAVSALQRQRETASPQELDSLEYRLLSRLSSATVDQLQQVSQSLYYCCLIDGGRKLAACGDAGELLIVDCQSGRLLHRIACGQGELNGLSLSPDGNRLAVFGDDGTVGIRETSGFTLQRQFRAHEAQVWQGAWSPDGRILATCGNERNVRFWETDDFTAGETIPSTVDLECLTASATGRLAIGGERSTLLLGRFPGSSAEPVSRQEIQSGSAWLGRYFNLAAVSFSPDSRLLAAAEQGAGVRILQLDSANAAVVSRQFSDTVTAVAFAPDGATLAVALADGTIGTMTTSRVNEPGFQLHLTEFLTGGQFPSARDTPLLPNLQTHVKLIVPTLTGNQIPPGIRQLTLEFSGDFPGAGDPRSYRLFPADLTGIDSSTAFLMPTEVAVHGRQVVLTLPALTLVDNSAFSEERRWKVHADAVTSLAYSKDGQSLYSVGNDGCICATRLSVLRPMQHVANDIFECTDWGTTDVLLTTRDVNGAKFQLGRMNGQQFTIMDSKLPRSLPSPFLDELVCSSKDGSRIAWLTPIPDTKRTQLSEHDLRTGKVRTVWQSEEGAIVRGVAGDIGGGRWLLMIESESNGTPAVNQWRLFDEASSRYLWQEPLAGKGQFQLTDDQRWLIQLDSPVVIIRDVDSGKAFQTENLRTEVAGISYLQQQQAFAVTHSDRRIRIYRCSDASLLSSIPVTGDVLADLDVSPDGKTLLGISRSGVLKAWNVETLLPTLTMQLPERDLFSLQIDASGNSVWITDERGHCSLLNFAP